MDYNEIKAIATKFNTYYIKNKYELNIKPLSYDDWYEKNILSDSNEIEFKIDEVINFLNTNCQNYGKRGFLLKGKKIRSLIRQKIKEGFNTNDFYDVIKVKSMWLADKNMHKYYRPMTLFGNKFEDYLNETTEPITDKTNEQFNQAIDRASNDTY
jgi:uncharacterized phage protein (TIGR02220 family)|tara:strand:+ start:884 stop:1348 length:465 start_codon:yes stop_codon:yes gene_type:complete